MATKVIKLQNGEITYLPITDASVVQYNPESISVESKITSVDALSKLGKIYMGTSNGPAASYQKVATTTEAFPTDSSGHPITGVIVAIKFSASSTYKTAGDNYTLEVMLPGNISTGEFPMWYNNGTVTSTTSVNTTVCGYANRYIFYMFDGTYWVWLSHGTDVNTTYSNVSLGQGYATCSTAAATKAKTASLSSYSLTANGIVAIRFENGNTHTTPTLNINSKGAKSIEFRNSTTIPSDLIHAGDIVTMIYNTNYRIISIIRRNGNVIYADETNNKIDLKDNNTILSSAYLKTLNNTAIVGSGNLDIVADWNQTNSSSLAYIKNKPEPLGGGTPGDGKLVPIPRASETVKVLGSDGQWKIVTAAQTVQISYNLKYCESVTYQNVEINESLWGNFADPTVSTSVFIDDINISLT